MNTQPLDHHPTDPPSSFPARMQCACFESGEAGEAAQRGTLQHEAAATFLLGADLTSEQKADLTDDELEDVRWAVAQAEELTNPETRLIEQRVAVLDDDFNELTFGTIDVADGNRIIDFKFGEVRDYKPQMAAYALAWMQRQGLKQVHVYLVYARYRNVENFILTYDAAQRMTLEAIDRRQDPEAKPTPCEYCDWCAKKLTCEAVNARVLAVATGYADVAPPSWHPSEIDDPEVVGKLMLLMRTVIEPWCSSLKSHAEAMAQTQDIPYFKRVKRSGGVEVKDIQKAFELSGLDPAEFLGVCKASFPQLAKVYGEKNGMGEKAARKELAEKLNGCLEQKPDSYQLRRDTKQIKELTHAES